VGNAVDPGGSSGPLEGAPRRGAAQFGGSDFSASMGRRISAADPRKRKKRAI